MEYVAVSRFKIKCKDCAYRGTADTKEEAITQAKFHLAYDWRSNTHEHTLKITEVLLVASQEEREEE